MTADADPCDITLHSYSDAIDRYIAGSEWPSRAITRYLDRIADIVGAGHILELGSGPGWDADYLEVRGVRVSRSDANLAFVDRLRNHGHSARVLDARHDDFGGPYDALYANAVLLHLSAAQVDDVLRRAWDALVPGGLLAVTLKEGEGSAWSTAKLGRPRHFTYWREPALRLALSSTGWTQIRVEHVAGPNDRWLFVLAQRDSSRRTRRTS